MIRLALLRHGHTDWNRAGRIQGRSDISLDDTARAELSAQSLPAPWDRASLWSSPLKRAAETAKLVAGRPPKTSPALIEMNWGDWEGLRGLDLQDQPDSGFRHIEAWGWDYQPPQGESPAQLWTRLQPWVQALQGDNVAVCHIGIMRILLAHATGWGFDGPAPFRIKRNRLFVLHITGNVISAEPEPVRLVPHEAEL